MFRQNPQHTGMRDITTDNEPKNVKEKFPPVDTGIGFITDITSSPSIGADDSSTVFIGSLAKDFFAIDPDIGVITGTFTTFNSVFSSPAIGESGRIYIGSWDGTMYELQFNDAEADDNNFSLLNFVQSGAEDFGHVSGIVIDGDTGDPVPNASVTIGLNGDITDNDGVFFVDNILKGSFAGVAAGGDNCERIFTIDVCGFQVEQPIGNIQLLSPVIDPLDGSSECPEQPPLLFTGCGGINCSFEQTKIEFQRISQLPADVAGRLGLLTLNEDLFTERGISASPLIGFNNWVYWGSQNHRFYGWDLDLECIFFKELEGPIVASPAQSLDGTVYVITLNGFLHAFNPDFSEIFPVPFQADGEVKSSPAVGIDGTIYFGSLDNNLYAVNPDGELKWKFQTDGIVVSSPAIDEDGTIYIGSGDGNLYAIEDNGKNNPVLKWQFEAGSEIAGSSASIGRDGDIYFGLGGEFPKFIAVTKEGNLKWCFNTDSGITSTPAISKDGTIFVGSFDGSVFAFVDDDETVEGFSVAGRVEGTDDGEGIPGALISITVDISESIADVDCAKLIARGTVSGSNGSFEVNDIPAGDYIITASADGFKGEEESSITVTVPAEPVILRLTPEDAGDPEITKLTITKEEDRDTCFPLKVKFKSIVEVDPEDTVIVFDWDFDDGQSSSEKDPEHEFTEINEFDVKLTAQASGTNISKSASIIVNVKTPPCARFVSVPKTVLIGETIKFEDVSMPSEGREIVFREWDFSFNKLFHRFLDKKISGTDTALAEVTQEFTRIGDHAVSLRVIQDDSEESTVFGTVTVKIR